MEQQIVLGERALDLTFKISGADQLINKMSKFADKLQEAAGKRAARKAMAIVRKAAQVAAQRFDDPETPESVKRNVYLQQSRRGSKAIGGVYMKVGILGGANIRSSSPNNPGGATWYWRFKELGTEDNPAEPFLLPALMNNVGSVESTLVTELNREIDRLAAGK